MPYHL